MAVSPGARSITATASIGGTSVPIISGTVCLNSTLEHSSFAINVALNSFPGGDQFFESLSSNDVELTINGTSVFSGEINEIEVDFTATQVWVRGYDHAVKLSQQKSSEQFRNQKASEIIQTIASRNGLSATINQAGDLLSGKIFQIDHIKLTDGISDLAILHRLAQLDGVGWYAKGKQIVYGPSTSGTSLNVNYTPPRNGRPATGNCTALRVTWNLQAAKSLTVESSTYVPKEQKSHFSRKHMPGNDGAQTFSYRRPATEQDHLDKFTENKIEEHARQEFQIEVDMPGDSTVDQSYSMNLQGNAFAQTYEIETITHRIGRNGYTMSILSKGKKKGRSKS